MPDEGDAIIGDAKPTHPVANFFPFTIESGVGSVHIYNRALTPKEVAAELKR